MEISKFYYRIRHLLVNYREQTISGCARLDTRGRQGRGEVPKRRSLGRPGERGHGLRHLTRRALRQLPPRRWFRGHCGAVPWKPYNHGGYTTRSQASNRAASAAKLAQLTTCQSRASPRRANKAARRLSAYCGGRIATHSRPPLTPSPASRRRAAARLVNNESRA